MNDTDRSAKKQPIQWSLLAFLVLLIGVGGYFFTDGFRSFNGTDIRVRSGSASSPIVLSPNEADAVTGKASIPEPGVVKIELYNGSRFHITDIINTAHKYIQ